MMRSRFHVLGVVITICLLASPASSQSISDSDFFSISSTTVGIYKQDTFSLAVSVTNKTPLMSIVLPLSYAGHPALHLDTLVGEQGITYDSIGRSTRWIQRTVLIDKVNKTILLGFLSFSQPLPPSTGPLLTIHFTLDSTSLPGIVYVDSTRVPPNNFLSIVDPFAAEHVPQFTRGVINLSDQVPKIRFNRTYITFWATVNSGNPPSQEVYVSNEGAGVLHWTAAVDQPWLSITPLAGTGNAPITVSADATGLDVGTYRGQLEVADPAALNSPHSLPVTLHVMRQPNPADSDYVHVSTAVAPTRQPSKTSVDLSVGTTRSFEAMVIPLRYSGNSYLRLDKSIGQKGVTWGPLGVDPVWDIQVANVDTVNKTVLIGLVSLSRPFAPAEGLLATLHFSVDSTDQPDTVVIDSTFVPPNNKLVFMDSTFAEFTPAFAAGAVRLEPFRDSLCATPEALYFNATKDGPLPPCDTIVVENCGGISLWSTSTHLPDGSLFSGVVGKSGDSLIIELCVNTTAIDTGMHVSSVSVWGERMVNEVEIPIYYRVNPPPPQDLVFECDIVAEELTWGRWDQATLGAGSGATDGYDPGVDLFKAPPPPGEYVRVAFAHPEWGLVDDEFSCDLRAPFATGCKDFVLHVTSSRSGTMRLTAACRRPAVGLRWLLSDPSGNLLAADFDVHGYTYPAAAGEQTFVLSVCGDGTFLTGYQAGWNLISSPLEPFDPGLVPVFGPEVDLWQLYGWEGSYFVPTEFHGCGQGYWLLLPEPEMIQFNGYLCGPKSGPVCMDLRQGWNLVGAPLLVPSRLSDAQFDSSGLMLPVDEAVARGWVSPSLWGWNGSVYMFGGVFTPGAGYWLPALVDGVRLCLYPFQGAAGAREDLIADAVNIGFAGTDVHVRVGLGDADAGFDARYDLPLPPPGPAAATHQLAIHSGMNPLFDLYYQDVRPPDTVVQWSLELTHDGLDTLSFTNTQALTSQAYKLSLFNPADSQTLPITADGQVVVDAEQLVFIAEQWSTEVEGHLPQAWYLAPNVPNPFNPQTTISFGVANAGRVELAIYNVLGRRVKTLVSSEYGPGEYRVVWDGRDSDGRELPSGLYFYRLSAREFSESRKLLLLR